MVNMTEDGQHLWAPFAELLKKLGVKTSGGVDDAVVAKSVVCAMFELVPPDLRESPQDPGLRLAWLNSARLGFSGPTMLEMVRQIQRVLSPHEFTPGVDFDICGICNETRGGDRHRKRK